jgi:hypothetical protein
LMVDAGGDRQGQGKTFSGHDGQRLRRSAGETERSRPAPGRRFTVVGEAAIGSRKSAGGLRGDR